MRLLPRAGHASYTEAYIPISIAIKITAAHQQILKTKHKEIPGNLLKMFVVF